VRALVHSGWEYTLFEDGDRLHPLGAVRRGRRLTRSTVVLTDAEAAAYRAQGAEALQGLLARTIRD
jgi:hypothetical protein